jgi:hypothetical protein
MVLRVILNIKNDLGLADDPFLEGAEEDRNAGAAADGRHPHPLATRTQRTLFRVDQ